MVLGSDFLVYPSASVSSAIMGAASVVQLASGAFSITDANLGATPNAALLIGGKAGDVSSLNLGLFDGTGVYSVYGRTRDITTPSNARSVLSSTKIYNAIGNTTNTIESSISTSGFSANTLGLSFDGVSEAATGLLGILLNLPNAVLTIHEFSAGTSVLNKTGLAFTPNFFITFAQPNTEVASGVVLQQYQSIGFATSTVNQYSMNYASFHNAATADASAILSTSYLAYNFSNAQSISLTTIAADGYTLTRSATSGISSVGVLACYLPNNVVLSVEDSPITTGLHTIALGADTKEHIVVISTVEAVDSLVTNSTANGMAIGYFNDNITASYGIVVNEGSNPVNTEAYYNNDKILLESTVGTTVADFAFNAYTGTGPQMNWVTAPGTAKKMIVLGIEN
jgi:hypothetical protein